MKTCAILFMLLASSWVYQDVSSTIQDLLIQKDFKLNASDYKVKVEGNAGFAKTLDFNIFRPIKAFLDHITHRQMERKDIDNRIHGGQKADLGQFPWNVIIRMDEKYFCAGSLISHEVVLTSAFCLKPFSRFTVFFGSTKLEEKNSTRMSIDTTTKIVHEEFVEKSLKHNIALLILPKRVPITEYQQIVHLPGYSMISNDFIGQNATLTGWGDLFKNRKQVNELTHAVLTPVENYYCSVEYKLPQLTSALCAKHQPGQAACFGDQGGALVLNVNGLNIQIGIFGVYSLNCQLEKPVIFTRVSSYLQWIHDHTRIKIYH